MVQATPSSQGVPSGFQSQDQPLAGLQERSLQLLGAPALGSGSGSGTSISTQAAWVTRGSELSSWQMPTRHLLAGVAHTAPRVKVARLQLSLGPLVGSQVQLMLQASSDLCVQSTMTCSGMTELPAGAQRQ